MESIRGDSEMIDSVVELYFEGGFIVTVHVSPGTTPEKVATELYGLLMDPTAPDEVFLCADPKKCIERVNF